MKCWLKKKLAAAKGKIVSSNFYDVCVVSRVLCVSIGKDSRSDSPSQGL
ncbi:hypothetical protein [Bartonella sp. ML70XJBT.G]|nr:hypothetical protein [Bartonella sp. ML70XJBT.G]